jgi:hypothetical protein
VCDQDAEPGWVDKDGLWWRVHGGADGIRPAWFRTLVSVMSASERVQALRHHGLTAAVEDLGTVQLIEASHPSGLLLTGNSSLLTAALCYWEDFDVQFAPSTAQHARQQAAFERAYQAVQAVGIAELGEPAMQGHDRDVPQHRWSTWRARNVLLAVYQAVGDAQFGASIQMDARRYPADAAFEPPSSFIDWMWNAL